MKEFIYQHKLFLLLLLAISLFRLIYIGLIPITPQEAYYWLYSRQPDWSYFDHPPLTAYSIWVGCRLFGKSIFGIKVMAVFWSALTNLLIYLTVIKARPEHSLAERKLNGLLATGIYNLTIFAHLYSIVMVPDTVLLFFWVLMIYSAQEFLQKGKTVYLLLLGVALGGGLLSKYTVILILPGVFLAILLDRKRRRFLWTPYPYLALILALMIFAPVIYWNSNHQWASFNFQFASRVSRLQWIRPRYFFQLLASQVFLLSPFIMAVLAATVRRVSFKAAGSSPQRWYFLSGLFPIAGFLMYSFGSLVKMNWLLPGYIGWVMAAGVMLEKESFLRSRIVRMGVLSSAVIIFAAHHLLLIPNLPLGDGNTWSGWKEAAEEIVREAQEFPGQRPAFIFSNSYKTASLLKFYLPEGWEVYAQNILGEPALQFDIWGLPDSLRGKDALYVISDRREYKSRLEKVRMYFDEVQLVKKLEFSFLERFHTRSIYFYLCKGYHGQKDPPRFLSGIHIVRGASSRS